MSARSRAARRLTLAALVALAGPGCKEEIDASKQAATAALDEGKRVVTRAVQTATAVASELQGSAQKVFTGLTTDGKLSADARALVESTAKQSADGIAKTVSSGAQLAPQAWEIAKVINGAVDEQTVIEPIVQKADDKAALDASVGRMPRVEVIEGVQVGFHQLDSTTTDKAVKERGYLVLWRRDDKLVGFVYRSRREIDIDALVKVAPRLVALFNGALEKT